MKPFLILQLRPIDLASDNEFEAFLKYGELSSDQVVRVRMEKEGIPEIDLKDYSGVILGGGPSNVSDKNDIKKEYQKRFEKQLKTLLIEMVKIDFPFLGVCYGIGVLTKFNGGKVSKEKYSEAVGTVKIELTEHGKKDDLLSDVPSNFQAYCGHKEACQTLPNDAMLLASSIDCPYQMIKFKNNIYATQFHTELDMEGIILRINIYKNHGYFSPQDAEDLIKKTKETEVGVPSKILRKFVQKYQVKSKT